MINQEKIIERLHSLEEHELVGMIRRALDESEIKYTVDSGVILFDGLHTDSQNLLAVELSAKKDAVCYQYFQASSNAFVIQSGAVSECVINSSDVNNTVSLSAA